MFYTTRNQRELQQINADTGQLQTEMWSAVQNPALAQPTPVMALAVSGMNDVLNSQGYTQVAWWNRIPNAAWGLMIAIAICCNLLVGYGGAALTSKSAVLLILPFGVHRVSSHRRHRQPARGSDSRASAKPVQPFPNIAETVAGIWAAIVISSRTAEAEHLIPEWQISRRHSQRPSALFAAQISGSHGPP